MKTSNHYLKIVEWSEEDQCYVGTCPGLMHGGIHGDDEAKVYKELCQAAEEWIEIYQEDREPLPESTAGKEYSGKFVVRVGRDLRKALAKNALRQGGSLNS
jgi:predicted HicB family RNase H-like nuclease